MQNRSQIGTNPESGSRIEQTFSSKTGSSLGVVQDGEAVLEDLLRSTGLELADEAEILPRPAATIVDLALEAVQLRLLRHRDHRAPRDREKRTKKDRGFFGARGGRGREEAAAPAPYRCYSGGETEKIWLLRVLARPPVLETCRSAVESYWSLLFISFSNLRANLV